jgi:phosphate transport system substrate-binding protein
LPPNSFAVSSDSAVVDYVSMNVNAIGFIGSSWISDNDDSTTNKFLGTISVAGLSKGDEYYQPYQAYIAQGEYPLSRDVVVISREARAGLATGFIAFVAGDKGQRIVLKAGLVPGTMPLRIIEINHEPF